ncbi:MAG TPA: hypothetical protein VK689_09225 [Armatimonadota bacterium]|nr:hypothetical protein [Armatimonadota bacterium]
MPAWTLVIGLVTGAAAGWRMLLSDDQPVREAAERDRQDLIDGRLEILEADVYDAVEVEEFEDEGPGFFLDVGDRQLLFLQGQYLYDYLPTYQEEDMEPSFPCRRLRIARTPHGRTFRGIELLGAPLPPSRVRPSFAEGEYVPQDGEIVTAHLASLDEDLRRLAREERRE